MVTSAVAFMQCSETEQRCPGGRAGRRGPTALLQSVYLFSVLPAGVLTATT